MPEADDLALLTEAALAAGRIAMRFWRQAPKSWDKGGEHGPVSEADLAVNAALKDRLLTARASYGWLSEETPDTADRLARDRVFVLDPIDGTRAFLAGEDGFSISLAVVQAGRPVAGVVHLRPRGGPMRRGRMGQPRGTGRPSPVPRGPR